MKTVSVFIMAAFIAAAFMMHVEDAEAKTCTQLTNKATNTLSNKQKKNNISDEKAAEVKQLIANAKMHQQKSNSFECFNNAEKALKLLGK